jgi:heptosyltransferase-2
MGASRARASANGARGHLVLRAPNWVGDVVMATPVFDAALASESFGRVTVVLRAHLAPLLEDSAIAGALRPVQRGEREVDVLRSLAPDAVALLTSSFGAAWRAFRARVPIRAGAALAGRGRLLTHAVVPPTRDGRRVPIPTAHLLRDIAGLVGLSVADLHPRLAFGDAVAARAAEILAAAGLDAGEPYFVCAPGAAFGAAKLWPPEHFAAVVDAVHERRGWRPVVTCGPGEEALAQAVVDVARAPVVSLIDAPRSLALLKPIVAHGRLLVVGDSGPRWFAAAFDVPCVSVMGPNFPELTASSLECCEVVRLEGLECAPCLQRVCPLGHHRCMRELAPQRVIEAVERVLARADGPGTGSGRRPVRGST